jgi:hypothetical protein
MFAGEWILKEKAKKSTKYSLSDLYKFMAINVLWIVVLLVGLQSRFVFATTVISMLCAIGSWFYSAKSTGKDSDFHQIVWLSIVCIGIGLLFEPYQGGIKKDPSSFSYWLITSGISGLLLLDFFILTDIKTTTSRFNSWLIGNGQNPMIAYVAFANVIWPILALSGLENSILHYSQTPIAGFLRGLLNTIAVAAFTLFFSQKKWFWKT